MHEHVTATKATVHADNEILKRPTIVIERSSEQSFHFRNVILAINWRIGFKNAAL